MHSPHIVVVNSSWKSVEGARPQRVAGPSAVGCIRAAMVNRLACFDAKVNGNASVRLQAGNAPRGGSCRGEAAEERSGLLAGRVSEWNDAARCSLGCSGAWRDMSWRVQRRYCQARQATSRPALLCSRFMNSPMQASCCAPMAFQPAVRRLLLSPLPALPWAPSRHRLAASRPPAAPARRAVVLAAEAGAAAGATEAAPAAAQAGGEAGESAVLGH